MNSPFTKGYPIWKVSICVPALNRHKNCAGPAELNVNRRHIRYGFQGAPMIDPAVQGFCQSWETWKTWEMVHGI